MSAHLLQLLALFGAFWTAIALYARRSPSPKRVRFIGALGLGNIWLNVNGCFGLPIQPVRPQSIVSFRRKQSFP